MSSGRGRSRAKPAPALEGLRPILGGLSDRKAVHVVVLDLRGLSEATDYFVIASGTSDAHVRGMADHLMSLEHPHHVEGLTQGRWVLLDYVDFVVHLFHPELRDFYQLERLWGEAPVVAVGE
ncbi:MAG TPA: ribosome silencing factor [Gemmatimonadales bacterium]|jgi:ribosome-associated protein|nr:ribosome silencing factor [Gemmatimonadales bacterium]